MTGRLFYSFKQLVTENLIGQEQITRDFVELFHPAASDWRIKAFADQAFEGILKAECYLWSDTPSP